MRESKDTTAKTVIFEGSAALLGVIIARVGLWLVQYSVPPREGTLRDDIASITIGVVLPIVAFYLARSSRGILLGEATTKKSVENIRQTINSHPNVVQTVELLTMYLAPKQILVNAHVNLKNDLTTDQIVESIKEIELAMKKAEPKVDMIFLEVARQQESKVQQVLPQHIG